MADLAAKPELKKEARMSKQFDKLVFLLKELFQLNQPDLDFGLYRIMHAKAGEITQFLGKDLLPQVKDAFSHYATADKAVLEDQLKKAIEQANNLGVDPDATTKVKELRRKIADESVDVAELENEVYDHLYSFFRRYYDEGDFLAKRVYKPGVYAIPYEGEEVKLHWANHDQYYIKTSEQLRDYTFALRPEAVKDPMRVHFRLADVAEGEHGNVKAAEGKDRVFILPAEGFIAEGDGELVLRFQYRPAAMSDWPEDALKAATAAAAKKPPVQKDLLADAVKRIRAVADPALNRWIDELFKPHLKATGETADYSRLEGHLNRYVARHTFDYFIHKDLGGFLRRELDFFIKNEIMHLDDVESESTARVEQYLSKIKVIRKIAHKLIDFLSQLEEFQKKLWLKKKFVIETSYCITLGGIPEEFYRAIATNDAQRKDWEHLLAIDELKGDLTTAAYSSPLTVDFLKAHPTLTIDTRWFDDLFTAQLIDRFDELDSYTDGTLVHGDNFDALSLLSARYKGHVTSIQIDPPYNTGGDGFVYKDGYQDSSWLALMQDRLALGRDLLSEKGSVSITIDRHEDSRLRLLCDSIFGASNFVANIAWQKLYTIKNSAKYLSEMWDSVLVYANVKDVWRPLKLERTEEQDEAYGNPDDDPNGPWISNALQARNFYGAGIYSITCPGGRFIEGPPPGTYWRTDEASFWKLDRAGRVWWGQDKNSFPRIKKYLKEMDEGVVPADYWLHQFAGTNAESKIETRDLIGRDVTGLTPKPVRLLRRLIEMTCGTQDTVLDFFAGSGTTGQATIALNRQDGGRRRFILVEVGDYFDTVLLPRLRKVIFASEWKDGKPKSLSSREDAERSPRILKVVRVESYEDTLNNLDVRLSSTQRSLLDASVAGGADGLKEEYLLHYMLDVETRGSQSLLSLAAFSNPTAYRLKVKVPRSDQSREVNVDLLETFNYLIGLTVKHIAVPQSFQAAFKRDEEHRLRVDGRLKQDEAGPWWFRTVDGVTPDGRKALVIWRKLTGNAERDNLVLDEWFTRQGYSTKDYEFDQVFVNGDNNLENLRQPDETWKVRLIEEDVHRLMFDVARV